MNRRSFLFSTLAIAPSFAQKAVDPAPPSVAKPSANPLKAKDNPGVKFHKAPNSLSKDAVTCDWTSFLGPAHNAYSSETKILKKFPASGPPLVWEVSKGTSYSSPAIAGDKLVFFHRRGNLELVECLHPENGRKYWQYAYPTEFEDRYGYNNGPRASPIIDGERVYTMGAQGRFHCLDLTNGQVLWKRDLQAEFKIPQDFFGMASTPLLDEDQLIVNVGAPGGPTVAAFDKMTGRVKWVSGTEWGPSYASPIPATVHGKKRVFVFAGGESKPPTGGLIMLDPVTGSINFTFPWRSKSYESVNASCPVIFGNNVFISASYKTGGAMLEITPDFKARVMWTSPDFGMHFQTPIHKDGYLYGFDGRNEPDASLACCEAKTGKIVWRVTPEWMDKISVNGQMQERLMSTYRGTLLHVEGRFLALGELGHLLWMELTPQGYKEASRAWLFGARETWALPVLSHGLLYIGQNSGNTPRLLCYDMREK